jgi:Pyruvate/2-oxoacid:ferredoxin oxidoreductase gamma subunit
LAAADANTLIVVNSARSAEEFALALPGKRVIPIDALAISRQQGLGRIVNSALLGALARVIQSPTLAVLSQALIDNAPKQQAENAAACVEGYRCADLQLVGSAA